MLQVFLLFLSMALLGVALGLPLILESDSPGPGILTFGLMTAMVALFIWSANDWRILLPVLALVALTVRLEREGPAQDARPERDGAMSRRTRLRFRLWRTAIYALGALLVSIPILFALDRAPAVFERVLPGIVIAMAAMTLFRFSFVRAARRDEDAGFEAALTASSAGFG
jgi:hypothetical protein